ncbi:MAG TPA: hypothetical protein PKD86_05085 [Gemmatales bacterium]|nr:hypothetical protein [Gemmatales bacterium]HMP58707.1 hypothetical protein [Gemmatales bacterium]
MPLAAQVYPGMVPGQTYQAPPPSYAPVAPNARPTPRPTAPPISAQGRTLGNGAYLPPMPEMLQAPRGPDFADRGRQPAPKPAPNRAEPKLDKPAPAPTTATAAGSLPPLRIPDPGSLGLLPQRLPTARTSAAATLDWAELKSALARVEARGYRLEKLPTGEHRFVCSVPYPTDAGRLREFVAAADSEHEAVAQVLTAIDLWRDGQVTAGSFRR